jgi:NDP-sugar pyrophosphorylase family protein
MKNVSFSTLILAAGLGTRLKPLTDTMPKALVPVANKPLLEHLIDRLKANGCTDIVVNVHHFAQQIIDFLAEKQDFGIHIQVSDERDQLLETGGAIKKAANLFPNKEPFLVHNVDILHKMDLHRVFLEMKDEADAALMVSKRDTSRYLLFDRSDNLKGWTNIITKEVKSPFEQVKANPQAFIPLAFSGIHVFSFKLLELMKEHYQSYLRIGLIAYNTELDFYESCGFKKADNASPMFITSLWT